MARNSVTVLEDATATYGDSQLHYQWCRYNIGREIEYGYRFMWSRDGKLLPLRGGARIPSRAAQDRLVAMADAAGWGNRDESNPLG